MPFCAYCGTSLDSSVQFCQNCGRPVASVGMAQAPGVQTAVAAPEFAAIIPIQRIVIMTVLSYGLYYFYWFYVTWRQYRDYTKKKVFPVWHALAYLVPIYGLFRTYAHMRAYKELAAASGVLLAISTGWVIAGLLVSNALGWASFRMSFSDAADELALAIAVVDLISIGIVLWILVHVQTQFNIYWKSAPGIRAIPVKTNVGDVVFAIVGMLAWVGTALSLAGV